MRVCMGDSILKRACLVSLAAFLLAQSPAIAAIEPAIEQSLRRQAAAYEEAFNKQDAAAVGQLWTSDGTYTDATGVMALGRREIERLLSKFFAEHKGTKIKIDIASFVSPEPGYVVERGRATLLDPNGAAVSAAPYVAVHKRVGDEWLMSLVNEATPQVSNSMADLAWLSGTWQLTGGTKAHVMSNELVNGGKILLTTFEVQLPNGVKETDLMVTNADSASGRLLATIYDANGAHGRATWRHNTDGSWSIHSRRIHPDGTFITATHVIKPTTKDTFSWESVGRSANGKPLPDTAETELARVK